MVMTTSASRTASAADSGALAAGLDELLDRPAAAVVADHGVAGLDQMPGHGPPMMPRPMNAMVLTSSSLLWDAAEPRRSAGSQAKLSVVVVVGLYSQAT